MADIERVASRVIHTNPWLTLREDEIAFAGGEPGVYTVVEKNDFAVVIPVENGGFWLVQQYRYALGRRTWEFPQGGWPDGESGTALELARAELAQETGARAERLDHLGRLQAAPGYATNHFDVFLARGLAFGEPDREVSEADMVHAFFAEAEVHAMIGRGEFADSNCVAALTLLHLWRAARSCE